VTPPDPGIALLPQPIAQAWHDVLVARHVRDHEQKLAATLDVATRLVATIALRDYLDGTPDPDVEGKLAGLDRARSDDWLRLIRACAGALAVRPAPAWFAPELVA
jgi:hypothetical protein